MTKPFTKKSFPACGLEAYFLADDSPEYPAVFWYRIEIKGNIKKPIFEKSLLLALDRHPLLRSRIKRNIFGWRWIVDPVVSIRNIDWLDLIDGTTSPAIKAYEFDLEAEWGFYIRILNEDETSYLDFQFHHACVDGLGAIQFIEEIFQIYESIVSGIPESNNYSLKKLDYEKFLLRHRFGISLNDWLKIQWTSWLRFFYGFKTLKRKVLVFESEIENKSSSETKNRVCYLHKLISEENLTSKKNSNIVVKSSLNDKIVTAAYQSCVKLFRDSNGSEKNGGIRIVIPFDLRGKRCKSLPVANLITLTMCDESLLGLSIDKIIPEIITVWRSKIVRDKWQYLMPVIFNAMAKLPWLINKQSNNFGSQATILITNLGRIFRIFSNNEDRQFKSGNLNIKKVIGIPPLRRDTNLALVVYRHEKKLNFVLRYEPNFVSKEDAEKFFELFMDELTSNF